MQRVLPLLALSAVALAACGSDGGDAVTITDAWARTSAAGQTTGAIYFDLTVDEDDTLISASVPASVAARAEVHEVVVADMADAADSMGDTMGDTDDGDLDDMGEMSGSDDMGDTTDGSMDGSMDDDMESGDMDSGGMDGAMVMRELTDGLPLTAGETVTFEPGGYHIMLLDLASPLEVGDEIELTLDFAEAGSTSLTVEVAESAP